MYRKIRNHEPVRRTGIKEYSPLLDLEYNFDIIYGVPPDEFHLCKEGLTKQMIGRIVGSTAQVAAEITTEFNHVYMQMKTFSETPRRSRHVKHINKFKGSELGVIMFSGLPALFKDCVPANMPYW